MISYGARVVGCCRYTAPGTSELARPCSHHVTRKSFRARVKFWSDNFASTLPWFRAGPAKSAEQQASAMAFIVWRVARHTLDRMRRAGFDVEVGTPYFAFLREVLVFLVALAYTLLWSHRAGSPDKAVAHTAVIEVLGPQDLPPVEDLERTVDALVPWGPHIVILHAVGARGAAPGDLFVGADK